MGDPTAEIRQAWNRLAGRGHEAVVDDLILRYSESHRHYHDLNHLMWVVRHVRDLFREEPVAKELSKDDRDVVIAAALFHDVIYCPKTRTSETDSARLAVSRLTNLGWSAHRMEQVATLIEATAGHEATSPAEAVLLDADLAILGAPAARYAKYVAAVRQEYSHVSDDHWRTGRATVLSTFLDRDHVFATKTMRANREIQAQTNLQGELERLAHR